MSLQVMGIEGEKLARKYLNSHYHPELMFQGDWLYKINNQWTLVEVKNKPFFQSPPFNGQGLDIQQVKTRLQFYKDTGIRCLFLVFEPGKEDVYSQWLDILNDTPFFDTKNAVRIYDLQYFNKITPDIFEI